MKSCSRTAENRWIEWHDLSRFRLNPFRSIMSLGTLLM
jgi:hypothetical protein